MFISFNKLMFFVTEIVPFLKEIKQRSSCNAKKVHNISAKLTRDMSQLMRSAAKYPAGIQRLYVSSGNEKNAFVNTAR
jgi:hypothetical protein